MRNSRNVRSSALAAAIILAVAASASAAPPDGRAGGQVVDGYEYFPPAEGTRLVVPAVPSGVDETLLAELSPDEVAGVARTQLLSPTFEDLSALPQFIDGGFAPDADELQVHWQGGLSAEARGIIELASNRGLGVRVYHHDYGRADLLAALDRAAASLTNLPVDEVSIDAAGGIDVIIPRLRDTRAVRGQVARALHAAVPERANRVLASEGDGVQGVGNYDSRIDDTGDFDVAGAVLVNEGELCTTGLALTRQVAWGTQHYLLTAAHCTGFYNGGHFETIAGGRDMGSNSWTSALYGSDPGPQNLAGPNNLAADARGETTLDATLINVPAGLTTSANLFYGGWNTVSHLPVQGTGWVPENAAVCVSGAATGSRCNIVREGRLMTRVKSAVDANGATIGWVDVVVVNSSDNQFMFGDGDSGAPIFYINPAGRRVITAIVQGGNSTLWKPCGPFNHYYDVTTETAMCSARGGRVTPISKIMEELAGSGFSIRQNV